MGDKVINYPKGQEHMNGIPADRATARVIAQLNQDRLGALQDEMIRAADGLVSLGQVIASAHGNEVELGERQLAGLGSAVETIGHWLADKVAQLEEATAATPGAAA